MSAGSQRFAYRVLRALRRRCWRIHRLLNPRRIMTFTVDTAHHLRIRYPLDSSVGCALYLGDFETAELNFLRQSLKPGDVVFDVGANAGIFTVIAAKYVGAAGQVHAFEPGQAEQQLLRENVALNQLANVSVFCGAVSSQSGSAKLAVSQDGALSSLAQTEHPLQRILEWRVVPAITLDAYMEQQKVARVNFLKVDVEGAEKLVFEGATRLLSSNPGVTILFEAFDLNAKGFGYNVRELFDLLGARGLLLSYLDAAGAPVPFRGYDARFGKEIYNFVARRQPFWPQEESV